MKIEVKIEKYEKPVTFVADEHPIVNDEDYCEIVTVPAKIKYSYDGCNHGITGDENDDFKSLVEKVIKTVKWNEWFYNVAYFKTFGDYGLDAPEVYDFEEDCFFNIENISNYVDNCKSEEDYIVYLNLLADIADKEVSVIII